MGDPASGAVAMEIAPEVLSAAGVDAAAPTLGPLSTTAMANGVTGPAGGIFDDLTGMTGGAGTPGGGSFLSRLMAQMQGNPMMAMMMGKSLVGTPRYGPQGPGVSAPNLPRPQASPAPWMQASTAPPPVNPAMMGSGGNGGGDLMTLLQRIKMLQGAG